MTRTATLLKQLLFSSCSLFLLQACSVEKQIAQSAKADVLDTKALQAAHVGISIFDPAANKYLYNYQGDKYFVPASNVKIPTCYAAMKYLGDSLVGLRYGFSELVKPIDTISAFQATGDPTFLHPDFKNQPVFDFLKKASTLNHQLGFADAIWEESHWGSGWSWSDYNASFMAERSSMPIYGNLIEIKINELKDRNITDNNISISKQIKLFKTQTFLFDSLTNKYIISLTDEELLSKEPKIEIDRDFRENKFLVKKSFQKFENKSIPFITEGTFTFQSILYNDFKIKFGTLHRKISDSAKTSYTFFYPDFFKRNVQIKTWKVLHSQPTDSLLKLMMHHSDNFFAEQSLLMVSNEMLGVMNDEKIIDTLLKTDFKDLPQKPRWADGSGLSRYNLFTPQDFISILNKMKNEFGMERIKVILPTGGEGTISSYYKTDSGYIYGKTGTLSGVVAFSGFLYTKKGKLFIFSTLVNNHQASATEVRRAVEKFLDGIRARY